MVDGRVASLIAGQTLMLVLLKTHNLWGPDSVTEVSFGLSCLLLYPSENSTDLAKLGDSGV